MIESISISLIGLIPNLFQNQLEIFDSLTSNLVRNCIFLQQSWKLSFWQNSRGPVINFNFQTPLIDCDIMFNFSLGNDLIRKRLSEYHRSHQHDSRIMKNQFFDEHFALLYGLSDHSEHQFACQSMWLSGRCVFPTGRKIFKSLVLVLERSLTEKAQTQHI